MSPPADTFTEDLDPSSTQEVDDALLDHAEESQTSTAPATQVATAEVSSSPTKRKTRAASSPSSPDKGKGKAGPAPAAASSGAAPATRSTIQRLESFNLARAAAKDFIPAAQRDFRRLEDNMDRDRETTAARFDLDRETTAARFDLVQSALVALAETTSEIRDAQRLSASVPHDASWQELNERVTLIGRTQEENDELAAREMSGIHQREDAVSDELRSLAQREDALQEEVRTLRQEIARLHASVTAFRPQGGAVTAPAPTAALAPPPLPLGGAPAPGIAPAPAPGPGPAYPRHRDTRDSRPYKRIRPMEAPPVPLLPAAVAPAAPTAGPAVPFGQPLPMQPAPPPMPLPGLLTDHPAIVRFGRVRWAVQPAVLRQQIYTCGRAAWDAYPGLFPAVTDLTLQADNHEFAEITFPSGSLARSFVDAWQRCRGSAGEWRRLQVHLV